MLTQLYRKIIPLSFRSFIYDKFLGQILYFTRNFNVIAKSKVTFCFRWILPETEKNKAYAFMGKHGITSYPYPYMLEYKKLKIPVEFNRAFNLPYILHNNKKLFFPATFTNEKVIKDYRSLIIEQDERSSHRYVRSYSELKGKTLLDIGSAEGIFALDTIELVNHVYLFECEDFWITALEATFAPWKEKVSIIKKYVSNKTNGTNITLDDFLMDKVQNNLFLKMDIEGAEMSAIEGAADVLKNGRNINCAITTYHKEDDPENISNYFKSLGYQFEFSDGLMYWSKRLSKGVIRCHN